MDVGHTHPVCAVVFIPHLDQLVKVEMLKCVPYRKAFSVVFFIQSVHYWRFYCTLVRGLFLSSAHLPNTNPIVQQVLAPPLLLCQHHPDQPVGDSPLTD